MTPWVASSTIMVVAKLPADAPLARRRAAAPDQGKHSKCNKSMIIMIMVNNVTGVAMASRSSGLHHSLGSTYAKINK